MNTRSLHPDRLPAAMRNAAPAADAPAEKPNILLLVADDLGWADVGWHGGKFQTPALDRLVREGVELDRHYVQPVCTPTRTALMSGRWTSRFGPHVLAPSNSRAFPPGTPTLASALKQCGYTTHISGKWHLGGKPEWGPNHYGFDHSYGALCGAVDPWTHKYRRGPSKTPGIATCSGWTRKATPPSWSPAKPCSGFASSTPRGSSTCRSSPCIFPWTAPEEYKRLYDGVKFDDDPVKHDSLLRLAAFVTQLDTKIGEFVAALEETGQRRNTLIVFTSDNGGLPGGTNPYVGKVADSPVLSSNLPLRGHKNTLYEGGVRVCAFANWPGRLAPRRVTAPLHAADWMPTLTKLAGWQPPADLQFDGLDVWPLLTGEVEQAGAAHDLHPASVRRHRAARRLETDRPQSGEEGQPVRRAVPRHRRSVREAGSRAQPSRNGSRNCRPCSRRSAPAICSRCRKTPVTASWTRPTSRAPAPTLQKSWRTVGVSPPVCWLCRALPSRRLISLEMMPANPSGKRLGMRKTGGLTPAVRLSVCNFGCGATNPRRNSTMKQVLLLVTALLLAISPQANIGAAAADTLAERFASPSPSAKPCVYWFWINGNISREGITADLEALQRRRPRRAVDGGERTVVVAGRQGDGVEPAVARGFPVGDPRMRSLGIDRTPMATHAHRKNSAPAKRCCAKPWA